MKDNQPSFGALRPHPLLPFGYAPWGELNRILHSLENSK